MQGTVTEVAVVDITHPLLLEAERDGQRAGIALSGHKQLVQEYVFNIHALNRLERDLQSVIDEHTRRFGLIPSAALYPGESLPANEVQ